MYRRIRFMWKYLRGQIPWDTNQTPPEVMDIVASRPPGRALDIGCGTGTNSIYLAQHGWKVTGVDYVPQAILSARRKAKRAQVNVTFHHGDVTHLERLPLEAGFDFLLDIGCFHALDEAGQRAYGAGCARLAASDALLMIYASFPRVGHSGHAMGVTPEELTERLAPHFTLEHADYGTDTGGGWQRGWYWLRPAPAE